MFVLQALVITSLLFFFSLLVVLLLQQFNRDLKIALLFIIPLLFFSLGFVLRMSAKPLIVDLGFFLTEFSSLFVSILFAMCLLLGQLKYWEK